MRGTRRHPASFRDPSGFLFTREGALYRQVNRRYQEEYEQLIDSGLYAALVEGELLLPHEQAEVQPAAPEEAFVVLRPEPLAFVSYPYEWCFSQWKDAALTTLAVQKTALEHGMSLKDSSAYNIQFHHGRPVLIDTLSFEAYKEGEPWVAYRQFCQHFLAPLALMAYVDIRLGGLMRVHIDGPPLDLVSELLPARTKLRFPLLSHIHLHAAAQRRFAGSEVRKESRASRRMGRRAFMGLVESLEGGVKALNWSPKGTDWGAYYSFHGYSERALEHKQELLRSYLEAARPRTVWDLGANTGLFSRMASHQGIPTLSFDFDPAAVELNYRECVDSQENNLLPLLLDLTNPSPDMGWANRERESLVGRGPADLVMALALVHHLAIGNNVPLPDLAAFFAELGRWAIVEFVPKEDPQLQRLLVSREDIFQDYHEGGFRQAFEHFFRIRRVEMIEESGRSLFLLENRQIETEAG
jgi:hypothetical protein